MARAMASSPVAAWAKRRTVLPVYAELAGDRAQAHAPGTQGLDGGVLVTHPHLQPRFRRRSRGGRNGFRRELWLVGGYGDLLEAGPVAGDGLGSVPGEVVPQMPAVSDLHRIRRAVAG